jgi:hypothetical protein
MNIDKDFAKLILTLFEHDFKYPLTVVMVGVRGYLVTKFELSEGTNSATFKNTVLAGKAKDLRFPINMMIVDINGRAAHVCVKTKDELGAVSFFPGEPPAPPIAPITWPKA